MGLPGKSHGQKSLRRVVGLQSMGSQRVGHNRAHAHARPLEYVTGQSHHRFIEM